MNKLFKKLADEAFFDEASSITSDIMYKFSDHKMQKFAELIVGECIEQVEQAKNSPFVSLDDAKRMSHFVDVTKKRIEKHFRS